MWYIVSKKFFKSWDFKFQDNLGPYFKIRQPVKLTPRMIGSHWQKLHILPTKCSNPNCHLSSSIHDSSCRPISPSAVKVVPSPPLLEKFPHDRYPPNSPLFPLLYATPSPAEPQIPLLPCSCSPSMSPVYQLSPPPPPQQLGRGWRSSEFLGNWSKSDVENIETVDTPKNWKQLPKSPNKLKWLCAADSDFFSLWGMKTCNLVPRPEKRNIIKSKGVFKVEHRADNSILKMKAWLVAISFSKVAGVDYTKAFAPTTQLGTLLLVFSLLSLCPGCGKKVDIKTAFLKGHQDESVYIAQPQEYRDLVHDWVCEVNFSMYGLKQSPHQWFTKLHTAILFFGLK